MAGVAQPSQLLLTDAVEHVYLERLARDALGLGQGRDLADELDVMGTQRQAGLSPCGGPGDHQGQAQVVGIDGRAGPIGDGRRLVVGTLDEADGGPQGQQAQHVGRTALEVGLDGDADVVVLGHERLGQVDGAIGVIGAFHVEPEPGAGLGTAASDGMAVCQARVVVLVEPELRGLDGGFDGARHVGARNVLRQDIAVVGCNLFRLVERGQVLAKMGEQDLDALVAEAVGCGERVLDALPGHEPSHGAPGERERGDGRAEAVVAGHPEEYGAHRSHGSMLPPGDDGRVAQAPGVVFLRPSARPTDVTAIGRHCCHRSVTTVTGPSPRRDDGFTGASYGPPQSTGSSARD